MEDDKEGDRGVACGGDDQREVPTAEVLVVASGEAKEGREEEEEDMARR